MIGREAKIWNIVFEKNEKVVGIEKGSIRVTVLIQTLCALFQMDKIMYELQDCLMGLNRRQWNYIFNYVKTFQAHSDLPIINNKN